MFKKILFFFLLAFAFIGLIGGIGYACYCKAYPIAVGVACLGYFAYPKFVECFKELLNG